MSVIVFEFLNAILFSVEIDHSFSFFTASHLSIALEGFPMLP